VEVAVKKEKANYKIKILIWVILLALKM